MRKILAGLLGLALASPLLAQDFPSRPVRVIVGFTPGGGADTTARMFGERLAELWKQPVLVENRPGAGGTIAADAVSKAAPDGHTLLLASNTNVISQVVNPPAFDFRNFIPIALATNAPMLIAVNTEKIQARNLQEFTAMLKSAPGKFSYTACNMASTPHFAMEMYRHAMGINALHVPHKGCAPSVSDAVAGHIPIVVTVLPTTLPFIKAGKLRAIALLDAERSPSAPDIPTLRESGIPELKDVSLQSWNGYFAPPGTPAAIVQRLEADIIRTASNPELQKRLSGAGMDMFVLDSKKTQVQVRNDYENLARTAKAANIKAE
jgi:tripartite-type tricarboxylate transporter receptor subunit TctC